MSSVCFVGLILTIFFIDDLLWRKMQIDFENTLLVVLIVLLRAVVCDQKIPHGQVTVKPPLNGHPRGQKRSLPVRSGVRLL